jgi:hypothetical protein
MEHKKLPQRLVRNAGVFYVCYRLYRWSGMRRATPGGGMSLSIVKARRAVTPLAETRVIYLLRPEVARDPENVDRRVPPAHHK